MVLLFLFTTITAQYSSNDYELLKTTFTKNFSHDIIEKYLTSDKPQEVISGILSAAHSKDTSFVPFLTQLDFNIYRKYISFAVGQIGYSRRGIAFLSKQLFETDNNRYSPDLLEAYGIIGSESDYEKLLSFLGENNNLNGFSYAMYNFNQRKIIKDTSPLPQLLLNELDVENEQKTFDALFGLARINVDSLSALGMMDFLTSNYKHLSVRNICYSLSSLRRANNINVDTKTLELFLNHEDWRIRTEAIRILPKVTITEKSDLRNYFGLIKDENPNVSRTACVTLRNLSVGDSLKNYIKEEIKSILLSNELNENAKDDLQTSYAGLFPEENSAILAELNKSGKINILPDIAALKNIDAVEALYYLTPLLQSKNLSIRMNALNALFSFQEELKNNSEYGNLILRELMADESSIVSLSCFSVDSAFIINNMEAIKNIITDQTNRQINNKNFSEGLTSLHYLAVKIDTAFAESILNNLGQSSLDDLIRYYKAQKQEKIILRSDENFDEFWNNAFRYSYARVSTTKGYFTMKLLPGIAPISVGNFCSLAAKNYFDNVVFHRIVPDFVAQVGDPTGTGWGGPGYTINSELSPTDVSPSMVGMASSGPDTEGSQWFIMHNNFPHLYGRYTIFAEVTDGMDIVNKLDQNSKIISIELK